MNAVSVENDNYEKNTLMWRNNLREHVRLLIEYQNLLKEIHDGERHGTGTAIIAVQIAMEYKILYPEIRLPEFKNIYLGGKMHDCGKARKESTLEAVNGFEQLSDAQRADLENHPLIAAEELRQDKLFDERVVEGIAGHHENIDGSGYPRHLKGEEVTLMMRIYRLADTWDALRNRGDTLEDRVNGNTKSYKTKWADEELISYLKKNAGTKYDEVLVEILLKNYDKFTSLYEQIIKQGDWNRW